MILYTAQVYVGKLNVDDFPVFLLRLCFFLFYFIGNFRP